MPPVASDRYSFVNRLNSRITWRHFPHGQTVNLVYILVSRCYLCPLVLVYLLVPYILYRRAHPVYCHLQSLDMSLDFSLTYPGATSGRVMVWWYKQRPRCGPGYSKSRHTWTSEVTKVWSWCIPT